MLISSIHDKKTIAFFLFFIIVIQAFSQGNSEAISRTQEQETWIKTHLSQAEINWLNKHYFVRAKVSNNPPMYFIDKEPRGISIDFMNIVSTKTGLQVDYLNIDKSWNEVLRDFKTNENVDLLLSLKVTEDRKSFIEFTDEYIEMPLVIFTKDDASFISSINDLAGKRIVVEKGFWIENQLRKEFPNSELILTKTSSEAIEALAVNQADAYIGNLVFGTYIIKSKGYRNLKVAASTPYKYHNQAMGVRKDWPELASILNKVFSEITVEEKSEIWDPYFAIRFDHGIQANDILKYSVFTLFFVLLVFAIFLFWNRRLKKEIRNRLEIEEQLKDSEVKFKALSDVASEGVVFSKNAHITECNFQACHLLGYEMSEMIGHNIIEFVTDEWKSFVKERAQSGNENLYETEFLRKDKTILPVEITARMIPYKGQMVRVTVFRDITMAKQAEKEREAHRIEIENNKRIIEEDNLRLKELDLKKNKFFSIIAHDLKGPIGTLSNLIEVLLNQNNSSNPELEKQIINSLYRSSKNTFALLENLLQWSKSEMGGLKVEKEQLNLSSLMNENLELLHENYSLKKINIDNLLHPRLLIYSDLNITNTIIRNLISNAIKFTYEFGTIKIYIEKETDAYIDLCIEDNGMGMEKSVLKNLFNLDSDHSSSGTKNETGTGLGLKLCKEFVGRVGGELYAESTEGKGSRFTVRLPRMNNA